MMSPVIATEPGIKFCVILRWEKNVGKLKLKQI